MGVVPSSDCLREFCKHGSARSPLLGLATNKYAEGYPSRRYYEGCEVLDKVEEIAVERACKLFGCKYANVQPLDRKQIGSISVLVERWRHDSWFLPNSGGHLTHGSKVSLSLSGLTRRV